MSNKLVHWVPGLGLTSLKIPRGCSIPASLLSIASSPVPTRPDQRQHVASASPDAHGHDIMMCSARLVDGTPERVRDAALQGMKWPWLSYPCLWRKRWWIGSMFVHVIVIITPFFCRNCCHGDNVWMTA